MATSTASFVGIRYDSGGHRWIDARRFNRLTDLPLDQPTHIRISAFQIPLSACQARDLASPRHS